MSTNGWLQHQLEDQFKQDNQPNYDKNHNSLQSPKII